ncbi:glycoside hydrolase family 108 protein [Ponticaulis profundi]|uniref:Glycoside hydrolase family 108 protein n=1 Tax=Ponticaulis profundi TaxID=2665222 RepID=A0ABW1S7Y4_9PROT
MNIFDRLIDPLLEREGGYVDHPADPGGATNYGITERVARRHGYRGHMRDLPRAVAKHIYAVDYWDGPGFAAVAEHSEAIAEELFDTGVNMGVGVASAFLQRALNGFNQQKRLYADIREDGNIGPRTIETLKLYLSKRDHRAEKVMLAALNGFQVERYFVIAEGRSSSEDFLYGWIAGRVAA